jgi:hypothetical protein
VKHIALFDILQVSLIGGVMEVFGTFHSQSIKGRDSISGRVKDGNILIFSFHLDQEDWLDSNL